jgi:hypothetical protein
MEDGRGVHTRFLPIFFGIVFALTLFFTVAAGAQEGSTEDATGEQVVQVQQQQVQNSQQIEVQDVQTQAQGCPDKRTVLSIGSEDEAVNEKFNIDGDKFRVTYDVTFIDPNSTSDKFEVRIEEGSKTVKKNSTEQDVNNRSFTVNEGSGEFKLKTTVDGVETYSLTVEDCRGDDSNNNNNNNNNNDGNANNDTTDGTVNVTQESTTADTTADTTTADTLDSLAETTTADNANRDDSFRCEFFLRAVRDDRGALRGQYRDDELIVQRFEQCLSADVLASTIPDRRLPFTGGPSLPFGGGLLLLVAAAVLAGRVIRR